MAAGWVAGFLGLLGAHEFPLQGHVGVWRSGRKSRTGRAPAPATQRAIVPGNQSFHWVAKATLTGAAQLGYFTYGGMTIVRASTDADAAPEVEIQLTGIKTLTEGDFRP
jgi:hypothetical protein